MSDLRDRIAAVIDREVDGPWEPLAVADAVIAELGLRQETEPASRYRQQSTRIVSDRR